jgi:H+/gluconate symporter-like permease
MSSGIMGLGDSKRNSGVEGTVVTASSPEEEADKAELERIYELEKGHAQFKKHGLNFFIFLLLVFLDIFRGSKKSPSMFDVKPCSWEDWTSLAIYAVICVFVCMYAIKMVQREQDLKKKYGRGLEPGDINMTGSNLTTLMVFSAFGGFASGALGLGGGSIFNPLLLSMGVPPKVASASGMYMIIFATGSSTVAYILNDMLNLDYSLWVGGFNICGTVIGMITLEAVMKKLNR